MIERMFGTQRSYGTDAYISAAIAACLLSACGRIGVEILPALREETPPADEPGSDMDAGRLVDGGTSRMEDDAESGVCESVCLNEHGSASCENGVCSSSCSLGYADCDRDPGNGCETEIAVAASSCGSCGVRCSNPHGAVSCLAGLCNPSCQSGFADCDDDTDNGCEADLSSSATCGTCGIACSNAHGTTSCVSGVCTPTCAVGYANCDGDAQNGCETNTASDPRHCGTCTTPCGTNGQLCTSGSCQASPCPAGRAECDNNLTQTCETDIAGSIANCGFCGNACVTANATPRCSAGSCQVSSCQSGFGNCDNNPSNGCEVALASSTSHCGACGAACSNAHGSTRCNASACTPTCSTGFGDCDTSRPNGCETALDSVSNCGACGRTCAANGGTPICNAGVCNTVCNLTGTYALKMSVNGSWPDDSYVESGSGTFQFWMRLVGTHSGTSMSGTLTECGRFVPPFSARTVSETFSFGYPSSVFDRNILPASPTTITLANASPGASLNLAPSAVQIGIDMARASLSLSPISGAWPSAASQIPSSNRLDMDGDGRPGVTAEYGDAYDHPRTGNSLFDPRSDNPYVASRVSFSLSGTLNSCTGSTGAASFRYIDTRIYGCSLDSGECDSGGASFLDQNCLNYTLGTATYTLLKVADGASCATVRAAIP